MATPRLMSARPYGVGSTPLELRSKRDTPSVRHSVQNLQFMELESVDAAVATHNAPYTV